MTIVLSIGERYGNLSLEVQTGIVEVRVETAGEAASIPSRVRT